MCVREGEYTCVHVPTCVGACRRLEAARIFVLSMCQQARGCSIKPQRPVNSAMCTEEEAKRKRGVGEKGVTLTGGLQESFSV